jgi:hypothetical protein
VINFGVYGWVVRMPIVSNVLLVEKVRHSVIRGQLVGDVSMICTRVGTTRERREQYRLRKKAKHTSQTVRDNQRSQGGRQVSRRVKEVKSSMAVRSQFDRLKPIDPTARSCARFSGWQC